MEAITHYAHYGREPFTTFRTTTYALGVAGLRRAGQKRPFTFRENILARVEAYERGDRILFSTSLFGVWLDSCTGIANKKNSTRFKIVSPSTELISIPEDLDHSFLPINYEAIQGTELDSSNGKYNQRLTKTEVIDHPGWLSAVEADTHLLNTYRDIVFAELRNPNIAMGFYVCRNIGKDELRPLFVDDLNIDSSAYGDYDLNISGSFLLGSHVVDTEKSNSPYRTAAKTERQVLEEKIYEILSPFDKYNHGQSIPFKQDKQRIVQELLGLYKGHKGQ